MGFSGEVCWGVGGGDGSCGKRCGGRCREVCWGVRVGKERCVGRGVGECTGMGPQHTSSLTFPYISSYLPNTLSYTSSYTSSHISPFYPHTPTHFPTIPLYLPSRSQSVAKLPCNGVSVAKLLANIFIRLGS